MWFWLVPCDLSRSSPTTLSTAAWMRSAVPAKLQMSWVWEKPMLSEEAWHEILPNIVHFGWRQVWEFLLRSLPTRHSGKMQKEKESHFKAGSIPNHALCYRASCPGTRVISWLRKPVLATLYFQGALQNASLSNGHLCSSPSFQF